MSRKDKWNVLQERKNMYRILVVEDDEVIAKTIRQHLQSWNYEVFAVADFNSVMEEFARVKPHLC